MTFEQIFQGLPNELAPIFMVVSMLSFGMALTVRQVAASLANAPTLLKALTASFVILPAAAFRLVQGFHLEQDIAIGTVLLGCSAGDAFTPKLTKFAGGDDAYAVGVMTLISLVTIAYMPIVVPLLLPGVTVDPLKIAKPLVILVLIPLLVGFAAKRFLPSIADRLAPPLDKLASVIIVAIVALYILVDYKAILDLVGTRAILSCGLLIVLAIIGGYSLGDPSPIHRNDRAIATGYRGVSAALAIAIQNFPTQHKVVLVALIQAILGAILMFALIFAVLRRIDAAVTKTG